MTLAARLALYARSLGVGAVATVVDQLTLAALVSVVGLAPRLASAPTFAIGVLAQFVGNKWLAFRDDSPRWAAQGAQFALVELCALAANVALFDLAMKHLTLPYPVVRLVTTNVVYVAVSLPLWSLIFRPALAEGGSS